MSTVKGPLNEANTDCSSYGHLWELADTCIVPLKSIYAGIRNMVGSQNKGTLV